MNLRQIFLSSKRNSRNRQIQQQKQHNLEITEIEVAQSAQEVEQQLLQFSQTNQGQKQLSYNAQCQVIDVILGQSDQNYELKRLFFVVINNYLFNYYRINEVMQMIINENRYEYLHYYYNNETINNMDYLQFDSQLSFLYNQDQMPFQQTIRYVHIFQQIFQENEKFNKSFNTLLLFLNKLNLMIDYQNLQWSKEVFELMETQLQFIFGLITSYKKQDCCNYIDDHEIIYQIYNLSEQIMNLYIQLNDQQQQAMQQNEVADEMSEMKLQLKQKQIFILEIILQIISYSKHYNLMQLITYDYLQQLYDTYYKVSQISIVIDNIAYVLINKNPQMVVRLTPYIIRSIRSPNQKKRETSVRCIITLLQMNINWIEQIGKKNFAKFVSTFMKFDDFTYYQHELYNISFECNMLDSKFQTYLQAYNVDFDEEKEMLIQTL